MIRRALRTPAAPAVALAALLVAGCGGGDEPAADATTPAAGATTSSSAAAATDAPTEAGATSSPTPSPVDGDTYTVQSGDTLSLIAREFDTTVDALVEANDIADPDIIEVGAELTIP